MINPKTRMIILKRKIILVDFFVILTSLEFFFFRDFSGRFLQDDARMIPARPIQSRMTPGCRPLRTDHLDGRMALGWASVFRNEKAESSIL